MKASFSRALFAGTLVLLAPGASISGAPSQPLSQEIAQADIERNPLPLSPKPAQQLPAQTQKEAQAAFAPQQTAVDSSADQPAITPVSAPGKVTPPATERPTMEIYPGTGTVIGATPKKNTAITDADDSGDITLNFVNADVRDVAKAVLGDFLKLNYTVGANVQGTVTMQTSRPLSRDTVLPVFEQALQLNGMALVKAGDMYKVVPLAEAPRESSIFPSPGSVNARAPGFGVEIVPLKYVSAAEMQKLLQPLAPAQGILHADSVRNVLIIEGSQQERATMLDDIALFDVDWLSGMSFALYTPKYTDAQDLAKDLDQIVGGRTGPLAGVVRFVPIDRLNAVLAISPQSKYLEQLRSWVERLDRPGQGSNRRIYVYHVQNGRASDIAKVLAKALLGQNTETVGRHPSSSNVFGGQPPQPGSLDMQPNNAAPVQQPDQGDDAFEGFSSGGASREMAGINITADEANNAIVIMASPQQFSVIEDALHQLDSVPLQVLLEAAIAEVTLTKDLQYGVQYFYQPNSKQQLVLSNSTVAQITPTYPGFSYIFSPGHNIQIMLNALSSLTHVEVISAPQVLVLNNQTATLQVGNQVPVLSAQAVSTIGTNAPLVNTVEYHDTGVILKVTPRVNQGGMVMMDISQEVSDVNTTSASTIGSPTISLRKINSSVAVRDGETIALGGLIKDSKTQSRNGIPFLSEIPVLGNLFRTTDHQGTRTELMVLITPHVVDSTEKARAVTEELRKKLPAVQPLFKAAE